MSINVGHDSHIARLAGSALPAEDCNGKAVATRPVLHVVDEPDDPIVVLDEPFVDLRGKRAFDLVIASILAIVTLPLQIIGLVVSAVAFRAVPIFSQTRVGRNGTPFTFFKIRSLPKSVPSDATKHDLKNVQNTRAGHFLRKTHFDELPQLWSVIFGNMSLVGPRPEMVGLSKTYDGNFVRCRTQVRPGVTGLWQISEGSKELIGDTPGYDLYYLRHQSWKLDLWVMLRTVQKMLLSRTITFEDLASSPDLATLSAIR